MTVKSVREVLATPFIGMAFFFGFIGAMIAGEDFYVDEPRPHH
jgi:hypothetical protein